MVHRFNTGRSCGYNPHIMMRPWVSGFVQYDLSAVKPFCPDPLLFVDGGSNPIHYVKLYVLEIIEKQTILRRNIALVVACS